MPKQLPPLPPFWDEIQFDTHIPAAVHDGDYSAILQPKSMDREGVEFWIKNICSHTGLKPSPLGQEAGIGHQSIMKFLNKTTGSLSAKNINAISKAAERLLRDQFADYANDNKKTHGTILCRVNVLDFTTSSVVLNSKKIKTAYQVVVPLPEKITKYPVIGIPVDDSCMEKIYPNGSLAFAIPFISLKRSPAINDIVIAFERVNKSFAVKFRQISMDKDDHAWLLSRSDNPECLDPIRMPSEPEPQIAMHIMVPLLVVASLRPELNI